MTPDASHHIHIQIPENLKPQDGRFGAGPSRVRPESIEALQNEASAFLGTSHRRNTIRDRVRQLQDGLSELFQLPDGWEVLLNNGGATLLWDALSFGIIRQRSCHFAFGEFSQKFSKVTREAPHLSDPLIISSEPGTHPDIVSQTEILHTETTAQEIFNNKISQSEISQSAWESTTKAVATGDSVDCYALTHNETSTGVAMELKRPQGAEAEGALVLVDATSAAGGMMFDPTQVDVYYFSPQKCFAADGGLWLGAFSPAAIARIEEIHQSGRWSPPTLDMSIALENSRLNQTYNTPALATIHLTCNQVEWMLSNGGLKWAAGRCAESATIIYGWAEKSQFAEPFVKDSLIRSPVVATIDVDGVSADEIAGVLRANGIVDTESYRKLGRNQLRIALFPAIEPSEVEALCACVDYVAEALS